jgi:hypothetical protein
MMDPCSIGPFDCSLGCRADSDVESVSLYSGSHTASRKSHGNHNVATPQPPNSTSDRLQSRISEFSKKGWLSQQEHRKYMALVHSTPGSSAVNDHVLKELEKELDTMEQKFSGGTVKQKQARKSVCSPMAMASCLPTTTTTRAAAANSTNTNANASVPQKKPPAQTNDNIRSSMSIVEPHQLEKDLSSKELSELFVEMSFFARLGFVQPPCCLQCTYRESRKEAIPNTHCGRWVVWRRNAKLMIHPNQLLHNGNLVVVKCTVARQLLAGKSIEGGYKWDQELEQLMIPPLVPTATTTATTTRFKNSNKNNNKSSTSLLEASKWGGFEIH